MTPDERIAKRDGFFREWASKHGERYLGYDNKRDFVVYKTIKADGTMELRCDNSHVVVLGRTPVSAICRIAALELQFARYPEEMIESARDRLLDQCRAAWMQSLEQPAAEPPKE